MNYNIELLDLVSKLSPIQQQLKFAKEHDGSIVLVAQEVTKKVVYRLSCPWEYFEFPGTAVRFFDYKKFKSFFDIFNNPDKDVELNEVPVLDTLLTNDGEVHDIIIKSSKSKQQFTYRTAADGMIDEPKFSNVDMRSPATSLNFSKAQIDHLQKMIGLIQERNEKSGIKFIGKDNKLIISFVCLATSNSYKIEYDLPVPVTEEFTFNTDKEGLLLLPSAEYKMVIDPRGLINFHMMRDDEIKLDLYVSKQRIQSAGRV